MASNCTLGIQNLVKTTLNNKPWFQYDQSLGIVNILDSFTKKINKENSHGVAKTTAITINKQINDGYKNIGDIAFVKSNKEGRGYIDIAPTINQIYLINAQNEEEIYELQKQLDKEETLEGDLQRKETGNWDVNEDGDVAPLNAYFQKNEEISAIDAPKDFNDLFNSLESIKSVLDLLNKPIFNNLIFDEYYLTETNKDRFKSIFIKEGLDEKSVDFIINFIEENRLQREKLSVVIGKIKQNLIFKSKGLNYYNAILTQQADNKLDEFLVNFLKEKLSVNVVKNSIEHYGSAMAVADILNKVILINNKNLKTLPEETGHFFFELLGKQNKLQLDLLNNVKKWEGYSMVYEKYKTTYVTINENGETTIDEEKIKREAVGQAIGEAIVRNHKAKNGDTFFSLLQEAVDFIKNLLNKLGIFNFDGTIDEIAKDILNQDISKIKQIKDDNYQKRTFKDTLANYPELQQMIDNFINIGAKLTGSLGYRDAGDLFRPLDEDVHDLDFRIYKEAFGDDIENFLNKVLKIYPQMKIRTHANGKHMMWTTNSKNLALLINIDGLLIDLFFYNYNSNNKESTVNWYEAFKEKYQMGRPKDMNDILRWANFTPINLADSTKPFVYYQLNEDNNRANIKPGVEELFETDSNLANEIYEALGFETTSVDFTPTELTSKPIGSPLTQSEGTGICDGTCGLMAYRLEEAGMPYGHAKIEDKVANYHAVALTIINGEKYILNQPQHEFLSVEYQKAPLWERAMFWRGMVERFNRHLPTVLNDLYFSEGINPYPALFGTVQSEYFGNVGPLFKDKKVIKREDYTVVTGTLIKDPSVRIAIKLEEGQTLDDITPEDTVETTKDGEKLPTWKKTEFTPRFIKVTKENLIKEYQLTNEQADASIKAINEAIINPGTKTQITPQQKQQAQQLYSQYLDTIFPDSKVKDIVYHGITSRIKEKFDKFSKEFIKSGQGRYGENGFFFSENKEEVNKNYNNSGLISAVINLKNTNSDIYKNTWKETVEYLTEPQEIYGGKTDLDYLSEGYRAAAWYKEGNWKKQVEKLKEDGWKIEETDNSYIKLGKISSQEKTYYSHLKKNLEKGTLPFNINNSVEAIRKSKEQGLDGLVYENILEESSINKHNQYVVFEPEQIHILSSKADIQGFKEFLSDTQKTEDYFNEEIKKIQKESKTIDEKISKFESTQKIDNKNTSKALQNMQEKVKIIGDKLLSLGFESINEKEHDFKTSSYITFKSKLKELENLDIDINTFKSPDYLIKTKIKSFKNNFNSQKQGELPFNPIELKIALSENEFIKDIADNTFEGLTDEQIKILKENLDKGEFNLNCKI